MNSLMNEIRQYEDKVNELYDVIENLKDKLHQRDTKIAVYDKLLTKHEQNRGKL